MSETTNRGGVRAGSGRKTDFAKKAGRPVGTTTTDKEYKPKINPVKELEKLYKELSKVKNKDELLLVQAKIDLLNKLLPYTAMKKPTESLIDNSGKETVIKIEDVNGEDGGIV